MKVPFPIFPNQSVLGSSFAYSVFSPIHFQDQLIMIDTFK